MTNLNVKSRTIKIAKMGLMLAVTVVCGYVTFPILYMAPYLLFELQDIPILIAGLVFGPISGFVIGVAAIILRSFMLPLPGDYYGVTMHIIAIGVYVLVTCAIYHKLKTKEWGPASLSIGICKMQVQLLPPFSGLFSLVVGGLCMTAAMMPSNIIITPLFMGAPVEAVYAMLLPVLLPFNLLKMVINTVVVFLLYKRLSPFLHKW
jgi:riboflavin transporter FmnP